jgi:hypothetical protein
MSENLLTTDPAQINNQTDKIPEKFRDPATGEVRVEALLKSYLELERRLSQLSGEAANFPRPPASAQEYQIAVPNNLFDPDPGINDRLHQAGFSDQQAQLVYELAVEYIIPMIRDMAAELAAEREIERLVSRFGGPASWRETSRQILAWANKNLPTPVVEALATTEGGVMAIYDMMSQGNKASRPAITARPETNPINVGQNLDAMIRDPRYWRDKDPTFIAQVTEGFRQKYGQ